MALTDVGGTPVIQTGYGAGSGCDGLGFGGAGWLGIILIIALLGGGFWGGNRGFGAEAGLSRELLASELANSQSFQDVQSQIRGLTNGICDSTFALNNSIKDGFYATQTAIQGVNTNLGNAICSSTYELSNRINGVGTQLQQCCCNIERAIDGVNFNGERNANAIIQNATANTQRILDYMTAKDLADKNQTIFDMSQRAQTAEIIAAMKPKEAIPAYLQPSPYETYRVNPVCNGCGCNSSVAFV